MGNVRERWDFEVQDSVTLEVSAAHLLIVRGDQARTFELRIASGLVLTGGIDDQAGLPPAAELWRIASERNFIIGCNAYLPEALQSGMTGDEFYVAHRWRYPLPEFDIRDSFGAADPRRCSGYRPGVLPSLDLFSDSARRISTSIARLFLNAGRRRRIRRGPTDLFRRSGQVDPLRTGQICRLSLSTGYAAFALVSTIDERAVVLRLFDFMVEGDYIPSSLFRPESLSDQAIDLKLDSGDRNVLEVIAGSELVIDQTAMPRRSVDGLASLAEVVIDQFRIVPF